MRDASKKDIRRKFVMGTALSIFLPGCEAKKMKVFLNISLFSYLDRPIFDVLMNGTDFGPALEHSFYGSNAVMVDQPIVLGAMKVTWRLDGPEGMPGNGSMVAAKNIPTISEISKDIKWLALHIYPDDTVEIKLDNTRDGLQTDRGAKIMEDWRNKHAE